MNVPVSESEFLKNVLCLKDEQLLNEALPLCKILNVKKGQRLISPGEQQVNIHLLVDGIFRGYFWDADGKDITDCLVVNPGISLMPSSDLEEISPCTIEAMTDSSVFRIAISDFYVLAHRYPAVSNLYDKLVLASVNYHRQLKIMMYQYSAVQRYHWFLEHYPNVIDRISHKYIASFLNMTPVTLSRLINGHIPEAQNENLVDLFDFQTICIPQSRIESK